MSSREHTPLRDRFRQVWAEWAPEWREPGRVSVGRIVITTRRQLAIVTWRGAKMGADMVEAGSWDSEGISRHLAQLKGESIPPAPVRHLHAV